MSAVPELYVYDHCPFCVRVRMAMGVKGIQHKLIFMGNDDKETRRDADDRASEDVGVQG